MGLGAEKYSERREARERKGRNARSREPGARSKKLKAQKEKVLRCCGKSKALSAQRIAKNNDAAKQFIWENLRKSASNY